MIVLNNTRRCMKNIKNSVPLNSPEARIIDYLRQEDSSYAACTNPYNVKQITQLALDENKNPLLKFVFQDILYKAEQAILNNNELSKKDVQPIKDFATDSSIRVSCMEEYIENLDKNDLTPKIIQKILAYSPKGIQSKLLMNIPWNTEFPVKENKVNFLIYALKKGSTDVVLKKFEEMTDEDVKQFINKENVFGKPYSSGEGVSFNVESMLFNVASNSNIKVANSFLKKFGHILNNEQKAPFFFIGNKIHYKAEIAIKNYSNTGKFLAKDFSKDEYEFVNNIKEITTDKEYKNFLDNKFNLYIKPQDFLNLVLSNAAFKEKFENNKQPTSDIKNKKSI